MNKIKSVFSIFMLAVLIGISEPVSAQWPYSISTIPERTNYLETSRYTQVMEFIQSIEAMSDLIRVEYIADTFEGKKIPLVIMSAQKIFTPEQAKALNIPVVYLQGNIHAGEVEGKESLLLLMREMLLGDKSDLLENQVVLFVPIYNADSNDKFSSDSRPSQENSPLKTGIRPTSQGWNLNRDGMKLEAPETLGLFEHVITTWDPEVFVDLHTTNGTWHGYSLTWAPSYHYAGEPATSDYTWNKMLAEITKTVEKDYHIYFGPYANFGYRMTEWPPKAVYTYSHTPRFLVNQMSLRNRIGILSEAFSHERFYQRIYSTHAFATEILRYTNTHGAEIQELIRKAEQATVDNVVENAGKIKKGVQFEMAPLDETFTLRTYDYHTFTDGEGNKSFLRSGRIVDVPGVQNYSKFVPTVESTLPRGYLIPAGLSEIADHLEKMGITVKKLTGKTTASGEIFTVTALHKNSRKFEGHYMADIRGSFKSATKSFEKGDYLVDLAQPLGNLAFYLLEPQSDDGLAAWNFFDDYLEKNGITSKSVDYPVFKYYTIK